MISASDFEGLEVDLKNRAGVIAAIIQTLSSNWGMIEWSGLRHDAFSETNQQIMSLLGELEVSLSSASWNAGLMAQELAARINELESKADQVFSWLRKQAAKADSNIETLSYELFGSSTGDLPPPGSLAWDQLYNIAARSGMVQ